MDLTSKSELPRPRAVSIYKCLPRIFTWTLMYKLSIVTAHSETTICVKPGGNTAIKFEWKKKSEITYCMHHKYVEKIRSCILRILSLSHSSSFSEEVSVYGLPFPFCSLSVSCERSNSSAILLLKYCIAWGNVVVSAINCTFSKWACNLSIQSHKVKHKDQQNINKRRGGGRTPYSISLNWALMSSSFARWRANSLSISASLCSRALYSL